MSKPVSETKSSLRAKIRAERESWSADIIAKKSSQMIGHLAAWLAKRNEIQQVLLFYPLPHEPDLRELPNMIKKFAYGLPVITDQSKRLMQFHDWAPGDELKLSVFKTQEPNPRTAGRITTFDANTLMLLPCLAASKDGGRLGFGAGFYDQFLADKKAVKKVAVCFEKFILDTVPMDTHDVPMDSILCENALLTIS